MIYTESYWMRFCGEVLPAPLHHGPTKGGSYEDDKFVDWYELTKESYRCLFGAAPPADIWPRSRARFANAAGLQRVDTSRFWLIPKVRFKQGLAVGGVVAGLVVVGVGCKALEEGDPAAIAGLKIIAVAAIAMAIYLLFHRVINRKGGGSGCGGGSCGGGGSSGDSSGCGGGGCGSGCGGGGCGGGCGGGGCGS